MIGNVRNWLLIIGRKIYIPQFRCPVKRLRVQELWHTHAERCEVPSVNRSSGWPTIEQAVTLINLLGQNLKTLVITLRCCLKVSPGLIKAIKTIQNLKSLTISFDYERSKGRYDLDSLSELFSVIPRIDRLSLHCEPLARLNLKPPALSNLRYFYFTYGKNVEGITKIIQASKNTLKFIEIDTDIRPHNPPPEGLRQVFEPIKDTLEGLFVYNIPSQLGDNVTDMDFPSLRVVGTQCMFHLIRAERYRLQAPMFKNVRTIVAGLTIGEDYWQRAFKLADVNTLKKVIRFKHIVFTLRKESARQEIDPEVVEAFESYGVQCHLTDELSSDEILVHAKNLFNLIVQIF